MFRKYCLLTEYLPSDKNNLTCRSYFDIFYLEKQKPPLLTLKRRDTVTRVAGQFNMDGMSRWFAPALCLYRIVVTAQPLLALSVSGK